jgi:hypothetical protein
MRRQGRQADKSGGAAITRAGQAAAQRVAWAGPLATSTHCRGVGPQLVPQLAAKGQLTSARERDRCPSLWLQGVTGAVLISRARPWNESWTGRLPPPVHRVHSGRSDEPLSAASALGADGRGHGKEMVYGSIP